MKTISGVMLFIALLGQSLYAQAPPANDASKWHITVFTAKDCQNCETLKRDFDTPHLAPWKQFAHLNFISLDQASQENRKVAFAVSPEGGVPIILVYPPKNDPVYPYYLVFRQSGYDGDELKLSKAIYKNVSEFQRVVTVEPQIKSGDIRVAMEATTGRCIGCRLFHRRPWCPQPNPDDNDDPDVDVDVDVTPLPLPVIPDITPDTINPEPDSEPDADTPAPGTIPDYPLVTIIYDPHGLGEESRIEVLKVVAKKLMEPYTLVSPKGQILEVGTERAKVFPTRVGDAPSIFITDRGKILAAISRTTIALLVNQQVAVPSKPDLDNGGGFKPAPAEPIVIDYQKIIADVVAVLKNNPALKGADGDDGTDGKDGEDGKTPVIDTEAIKKEILDSLPPVTHAAIDYDTLDYELLARRLPPFHPSFVGNDIISGATIKGGVHLGESMPMKIEIDDKALAEFVRELVEQLNK